MKYQVSELSPEDRAKRKRFLTATLITCLTLAIIGGSLHVVWVGWSARMAEMRSKASYDTKDMLLHVRAAGEDIVLHEQNEARKKASGGVTHVAYRPEDVEALLSAEQWADINTMITIPAGTFAMGTNLAQADAQDHPQHQVNLPEYRIDKYLVTNAQYARFLADTGHRPPSTWKDGRIPPGKELHPVTMVSWYDARAYATWAGKRLPSEAEWEKAARGTDGRRWPWGNTMEANRLNTYYNVGTTTVVNAYKTGVSPYGVFDMAGNVTEWIDDDFLPYEGTDAPSDVFQGKINKSVSAEDRALNLSEKIPVKQNYKVLRGGSWKSDPFSTATYHRSYNWPNYASDFFGFRCVTDASGPTPKTP